MKIINITIEKLFGHFDYHLEFNLEEKLTIITGPNGYGKTTILNIINNLFNQNFLYFHKLTFDMIEVSFVDSARIKINKEDINENEEKKNQLIGYRESLFSKNIVISLFENNEEIIEYRYNILSNSRLYRELQNHSTIKEIGRTSIGEWVVKTNRDEHKDIAVFLSDYSNSLPDRIIDLLEEKDAVDERLKQILDSQKVYMIKEQRLLKQIEHQLERHFHKSIAFTNTIEDNAKELKELIKIKQLEALEVSQRLDSSFPRRLLNNTNQLTKDEFVIKYEKLIEKQKKLQEYGITVSQQDMTVYNHETATVLTVYLEDSERKLEIYEDLLTKLNLFASILNQKDFVNKSFHIDSRYGFYFMSKNGQLLNLADLSSGEQHEVVLLYELLFKTESNTLILIDEPEISLHVIWQKAFVEDLERIAKIRDIPFLISTHSPQIVNNRWELTKDLFELAK